MVRSLLFRILTAIYLVMGSAAVSSAQVTADAVIRLVKNPKNQVTSIEALLPLLPVSYRSSYVLLHTSRSIQQASPLKPRVLLMGYENTAERDRERSQDVIMSFNGGGEQFGGTKLEMLQWRAEKKKYELFEISFQGGKAEVSEANPARCLACHSRGTKDAMPLWDPYFLWAGAYGSNDGHVKAGSQEDRNFREFVAGHKDHPRYKHLPGLEKVPFNARKQEYFAAANQVLPSSIALATEGYWLEPVTGNGLSILNQRFDEQAAQNIFSRINAHPKRKEIGELLACARFDIDSFLENLPEYYGTAFAAYQKQQLKVRQRVNILSEFTLDEIRKPLPPPFVAGPSDQLVAVSWIAQAVLGMDPTSWTSGIGDRSLNFFSPNDPTFGELTNNYLRSATPKKPEGLDCEKVVARAAGTYPGVRQYGSKREDFFDFENQGIKVPQVALLCASCHVSEAKAIIPFHQPWKLATLLTPTFLEQVRTRISKTDHPYWLSMPYQAPLLSPADRKELLDYLKRVGDSVRQ